MDMLIHWLCVLCSVLVCGLVIISVIVIAAFALFFIKSIINAIKKM